MSYLETLKELDKTLQKQIQQVNQTNWFKRHVVADRLKSALCHVKRELNKGNS